MSSWRILKGDCVGLMAAMPSCSVDAVVCDPPYGLEFMGKEWDRLWNRPDNQSDKHNQQPDSTGRGSWAFGGTPSSEARVVYKAGKIAQEWHQRWAVEALRVLKPGGHLLAFGGTRTYHRLACAVEDAGFEIRDTICWLYGSGFPKSRNLNGDRKGWGTALKPAHEPVVVARKPLAGTVAANVLEHGTGALNIDGCRIDSPENVGKVWTRGGNQQGASLTTNTTGEHDYVEANPLGRWPANVILDEEAAAELDRQSGDSRSTVGKPRTGRNGEGWGMSATGAEYEDSGGASRFFYVAKSSRAERNAGLDGFKERQAQPGSFSEFKDTTWRNHHPTVKPVNLMRHLVRLVTPSEGLVLDPFAGSGTTGIASTLEGFRFIGLERDGDYVKIARARIGWWAEHGHDALRIVAERERAEAEREAVREAGQLELI